LSEAHTEKHSKKDEDFLRPFFFIHPAKQFFALGKNHGSAVYIIQAPAWYTLLALISPNDRAA
jgi:hypothetical protein